jgi:transcription antitermination factor NusG
MGTVVVLLQAIMALLPQIPELIQGVQTAIGLVESGATPTPAQQAQIDAALDAAHAALQSAQQGA